jgi:hypothetical protein
MSALEYIASAAAWVVLVGVFAGCAYIVARFVVEVLT